MALSNAEKVRRYREREKQASRAMPDSTYPFLTTPFFEWLADDTSDWNGATQSLNAAGIEMPLIIDDSGPKALDYTIEEQATEDWHPYAGYEGSIGRAESMVDYMYSALTQMTAAINAYKVEQINRRIAELEAADLSDPTAKKRALADIVRLTKMREHLGKTARVSLAQWSVKGL